LNNRIYNCRGLFYYKK